MKHNVALFYRRTRRVLRGLPVLLLVALSSAVAGVRARPENEGRLPLESAFRIAAQTIAPGRSVDLPLPPLPAKSGKTILLKFRAVLVTPAASGCNYNAAVRLNAAAIGRYTAAGEERLIGREAEFRLRGEDARTFPVFSGPQLMVLFAPNPQTGDAMTQDGRGATYALDLSDLARGVDGNTLHIQNLLTAPLAGGGNLRVEEIEVGWIDRQRLPRRADEVPQRGPLAEAVGQGSLSLAQAKGGGFAIRAGEKWELRVETALGMKAGEPPELMAEDTSSLPQRPQIRSRRWGPAGYRTTALWPDLRLERTVELRNGLVDWRERWTNTGRAIRGVPFHHVLFLRDEAARFFLGGSPDDTTLVSSPGNPTLFVESRRHAGSGVGVVVEDDWLRLLMGLRGRRGKAEVYTDCLALAPGASIDFRLVLLPVAQGGYWRFINALRQRWGMNGITMKRPMFFDFARAGRGTFAAQARKALGHLGPIYVVQDPWLGLQPDARLVRAKRYPRLAADRPRAPGACADLDVEAFLRFQHRQEAQESFIRQARAIRQACPQAQVLQMMHPAMEVVYKPLRDRWPIASEAIIGADGLPFEDTGYSRAWLSDMADRDWGVLYHVPRAGTSYLQELLGRMRTSLDASGSDGIYCDEFSWASPQRGYSRYDYSRWDGISADLDAQGGVLRLKCDNAFVTEVCQLQMAQEALRRGKFFLGNSAAALHSVNRLPIQRFVEGGNGYWRMAGNHLSATPLILGNMGDQTTRRGVFESVKQCLSLGCVYSPPAVNLLLQGPDNFVCKQYPLTVQEIGPGWVVGKERVITTISRRFAWPGRRTPLRLYRYDAQGNLLGGKSVPHPASSAVRIEVPTGGMVIAERVPG